MKTLKNIVSCFIIFISLMSCRNEPEPIPKLELTFLEPISWKEKFLCEINYKEGDKTVFLRGKIKLRGGFSRKYSKHSFALELSEPFPLGNISNDDDWIINANYIDKTFMRHKLNYDLFMQMHPNNRASKSTFINLKIGDKEKGLHVLMEEINGAMLEVDQSDSMAMVFKEPPIFYPEKQKSVQDSTNYYQQKYPKIKKSDKGTYIQAFADFLFHSSDSLYAANIENWIDINNVMDWHILLLLSNNGDGVMKNYFLYKLDSNTPFRIAPWDYDHSFGREGDYELNMLDREVDCKRTVLIRRLMDIPETNYKIRLKNRWEELRQDIITIQNIFKMIDKNQDLIKNDLDANFAIWPLDSKWYSDSNTHQQEVDLMKEFIEIRLESLDQYFGELIN